jgi:hypothetical protein
MRVRTTLATLALITAAAATACTPTSTGTNNPAAPVPATTATAQATKAAPAGDGDKLADVAISDCTVDETLHWPAAEVKITNHTSKSSNYMVQVEFVDETGTRIGQGVAATNNLAPGQSALEKAQGAATAKGKISCKVSDVTRYAAP